MDAECNWWNSPSGPTNASNPGGTGEEVAGDADFSPWLTARTRRPCIGGLPSTPGKVTGGGQVAGQDPLFSPLGDLISLPALVVNTNGGAQANFGFVIQFRSGDTAPKGNLQYQDHDADVRIKATSYDQLIIGTGRLRAEHPRHLHRHRPGKRRIGVAHSRSGRLRRAKPRARPQTRLSIQTDSYSNGGPLIGGNIQIH